MTAAGAKPPIILIGMHRSGTSMLTRLLESMGLFVGWRKDSNHEATFFIELNDWFLHVAGTRWHHPDRIADLIDHPEARRFVVAYAREALASPRAVSFLGPRLAIRRRHIASLAASWGWKDPRNTFTLPLWLDIFPDARIVHIARHGVDVAASLHDRHHRWLEQAAERRDRALWQRVEWLLPGRKGFDALQARTIEGAFALWGTYMDEARRHVNRLGSRAHDVQYERVLEDPRREVEALAAFCELDGEVSEGSLEQLDPSRAYAYRRSSELRSFAEKMNGRLARHGYQS